MTDQIFVKARYLLCEELWRTFRAKEAQMKQKIVTKWKSKWFSIISSDINVVCLENRTIINVYTAVSTDENLEQNLRSELQENRVNAVEENPPTVDPK